MREGDKRVVSGCFLIVDLTSRIQIYGFPISTNLRYPFLAHPSISFPKFSRICSFNFFERAWKINWSIGKKLIRFLDFLWPKISLQIIIDLLLYIKLKNSKCIWEVFRSQIRPGGSTFFDANFIKSTFQHLILELF